MPNIVLFGDIVYRTGLEYGKACQLLKLAEESPAAKLIKFSIVSVPNEKGWKFLGRPKSLTAAFIDRPEDFVINDDPPSKVSYAILTLIPKEKSHESSSLSNPG